MRQAIFIALFGLLLLIPGLQTVFRFVPEARLYGASAAAPRPVWSLRAWWNGTLQKTTEEWLNANIGLRGHAVRADNQIGYSLFHESWSKAADIPVLGRRGTVFEQAYIDVFNGRRTIDDQLLAARADDLARLHARLRDRGILLLIALAPSKADVYPEWIDPAAVVPAGRRIPDDAARMIPMLRARGIPLVDGNALFLRWKAETNDPLFPPQGIHWNRLGTARFVDAVWREMEPLLGRRLPRLSVTGTERAPAPNEGDAEQDVGKMLNVWRIAPSEIPHVRATLHTDLPPDGFRPRIVVVGDSFSDLMYDVIMREGMAETGEQFFYFRKRFRFPERKPQSVDPATLDWEREIFAAHAVILEVTAAQVAQAGYTFVEEALARLPAKAP